jgi:monothiol bacilliredoxin
MGLFSSSESKESFPWTRIESIDQLNEVLLNVSDRPKLLFKHSTRCGVSSMALNSFENQWESGTEICDLYFVDLLRNRDVSNEIAEITGIMHQSPQAIIIKGKEIIYDATHSSIDSRKIQTLLKEG